GRNCGLRNRDFPPSRRTDQAATPVAKCRARRGLEPNINAGDGRQKGARAGLRLKAVFLVEGADRTMLVFKRLIAFVVTSVALLAGAAYAAAPTGEPHPWQLGLQAGVTPVMDDIVWFHDFLLWLIAAITLFVLGLLV